MSPKSESTYYLVPNLRALDTSAREVDAKAYAWVQPTVIEDEDLTFGGKSLSTWYEEDRRRLSSGGSDDGRTDNCSSSSSSSGGGSGNEEERRGRARVRRHESMHS